LKPLDKKITFLPGQFAFLKFEINGELNESHPFSFSSAPQSPSLRFSIKKLGEFTQFIEQIPAGTIAKIDGPYGTFSYKTFKNKRQVWVAGGIGITPFLSMATSLQGDDQKVDLYYCVKDDSEAVYLGELSAIADKQKNLRMIPIMSNQVGLLTAQTIFAKSDDLDEAAFLICGPKTMMSSLRAQLRSLGVANRYIHTEEFDLK
jgi:predicted ferric reductase